MDERISSFIKSLREQLDGLPENEINKAVSYYEEYLSDAAEAGKNLDEVLMELGPSAKISGMVRAEMSIVKAQRSPGLGNFMGVLKNAFHGVTAPLAILALSIFVAISLSMVAVLFAGAVVVFIGAVAVGVGFIYEALIIPSHFKLEILGTIGIALGTTGILLIVAFGLYKLGRLLVKISTGQIHRMQRKSGKPIPRMNKQEEYKKSNSKRTVLVCAVISAAGFLLFSISGLPVRYFTIFNSMKPENITMRTEEFDPGKINRISVTTEHSCIKLMRNSSDRILISYEQPDWLDYETGTVGNTLSFHEKSNGRLPLFELSKLHESRTQLVISMPEKYSPYDIDVKTTGGFVYIDGLAENINVNTYTGNIFIIPHGLAGNFNIKANTGDSSFIKVSGKKEGKKTNEGVGYYKNMQSKKTLNIKSSRGIINIE